MIVGQNTLLNQYAPTFYIRNVAEGQTLVYDNFRKAYINTSLSLGHLSGINPDIDDPFLLQNGESLVYNSITGLWTNSFIDYDTLLNQPTSSSFSFAGLSDTAKTPLADGYVKWNSTGTQLIYSTTIPASSITGLATVAYTGNYDDLQNIPPGASGVTSVSVVSANGISGTVATPNSTPAITLTLDHITPTSVISSGIVSGSNLSGINTGDQEISLTGDVSGTGTGVFTTTLTAVNPTVGTFGSSTTVPQFTVDNKGRITHVANVAISATGTGSVTSVSGTGTVSGLTLSGTVTSSGSLTLSGNLIVTSSQITTGLGFTPYNASNPNGYTANVGTVTSINAAGGTTGLSFYGGPITTSGSVILTGTLNTSNGGTGLTAFAANRIFYAGTSNTMSQSSNFTFDGTSVLQVGGTNPLTINGNTNTIAATTTDSNITLSPNGAGTVVINSTGANVIQSSGVSPLTVRGNNGLTISGGNVGINVIVNSGQVVNKISISGPTASDYATNLAANDVPNKYYVDAAVNSGSFAGGVKAYQQTVSLITNGTTAIASLPAGSTILSVMVNITSTNTAAVLSVGKAGSVEAYMAGYENDPQSGGLYLAECYVKEINAVTVIATVSGSTGSGTASVLVTYQLAQ